MASIGGSAVPAQQADDDYSNISRNDFPKDFIFGSGTSAYQVEGGAVKGGKGPSVWDVFTLSTPGKITGGSNGNVADDMYNKYKDDIKMMKNIGFDAYRFSISWTRILPGGKLCMGVNQEGIDYYNDLINTLLENDMEPFVTIFHWDLPTPLQQEYGGFLNTKVMDDFRDFAELCFWEFGDRVKNWVTLNEPWTYTVMGYVNGTFPPGNIKGDEENVGNNYISYRGANRVEGEIVSVGQNYSVVSDHIANPTVAEDDQTDVSDLAKDPYTVAKNLLLAHAAAVHSYRTKFQEHQKGKIGITLVCHWFEPFDDNDKDNEAAKRALDFMLGWFLEPVLNGTYPDNMTKFVPPGNLAPFSEDESKLLKGSIDFLGLNYYTARYAKDDPHPKAKAGYYKDQHVAFTAKRDGKFIGERSGASWLFVVPWGIHKLLNYVNDTYSNTTFNLPAIYITENGVAQKMDSALIAKDVCIDKQRVDYHRDHLGNILKAMKGRVGIKEKGVDVKGYFAWAWADNFEWTDGYTYRFGMIYIDYMNDLKRYPKDSAMWFSKFLVKTKLEILEKNAS